MATESRRHPTEHARIFCSPERDWLQLAALLLAYTRDAFLLPIDLFVQVVGASSPFTSEDVLSAETLLLWGSICRFHWLKPP